MLCLAADAQVDRNRTPWLVAGLHRQMVGPTSDPVNILTLQRLQADLEDLFLQYKVDLVLQGGCSSFQFLLVLPVAGGMAALC